MTFRTEADALGQVKVPKDAYYGSFTTRALKNFQISGQTAPPLFRRALGMVKLAACRVNTELKQFPAKEAHAIERAAKEFMGGKFDDEFVLDVFQAGAGTPYNMNANEIIANRANEILKSPKGSYKYVHPNDHVNRAQSSNDVTPTATRLAVLMALEDLTVEIRALSKALSKKGIEFADIIKVGRTHLQDAVPVTLGQEFMAYSSAMDHVLATVIEAEKSLHMVGIGGTAAGTGLNAHPQFQKKVVAELAKLSGFALKPAPNLMETTHSMATLLKASSALRALAVEVNRISNDLQLMNMGPKTGLNEISLPKIEPGSSIMPGKVNPSAAECMNMICFEVIGNDQTVALAAQGGQLELNCYTPIMMYDLLFSCQIMTNGLKMFREECIVGMKANKRHIKATFSNSLATATALTPYLGYHEVAMLVNEALEKHLALRDVVASKKLMTTKELDRVLSPEHMVKPQGVDTELVERVRKRISA